ncbi:hypothetical protein AB0D10_15825 [Kitasatospora sp. NPDC048545]|uniref:hypothetical protein n=1 Tax=Kitasatospora sp. NPDC048545 TaxID=3157208 RepID=UPI0033E8831D
MTRGEAGHPGLAALPGARLWLRHVADDLEAGTSCLLLFPATMPRPEPLLADLLAGQPHWRTVPPPDAAHQGPADRPGVDRPGVDRPGADRGAAEAPDERLAAAAEEPLWSGQLPVLDIDDDFVTGVMAAAFGTDSPAPAPFVPRARTAPDRARGIEARLEGLLDSHPTGTLRDVYQRLTTGPHTDGCVYVVDATREDDPEAVAHLLLRLPAAAKEAGLPPHQRPRLLVAATPDHLPAAYPDRLGSEDIAVHWWWGALSRIDTAAVATVNRPRRSRSALTGRGRIEEAVALATVVEVCGPYLDHAAHLATHWDGRPDTLRHALAAACATHPPATAAAPTTHRTGGLSGRPPSSLRDPWNAGAVDSWDGHLRAHPAAVLAAGAERSLDKLVWLAQSRTLLPLIDDAREALVTAVLPSARLPADRLAVSYGPERRSQPVAAATTTDTAELLRGMELNMLARARRDGHVRLTLPQSARLAVLLDARNCLSHREPLRTEPLARLYEHLSS